MNFSSCERVKEQCTQGELVLAENTGIFTASLIDTQYSPMTEDETILGLN